MTTMGEMFEGTHVEKESQDGQDPTSSTKMRMSADREGSNNPLLLDQRYELAGQRWERLRIGPPKSVPFPFRAIPAYHGAQ